MRRKLLKAITAAAISSIPICIAINRASEMLFPPRYEIVDLHPDQVRQVLAPHAFFDSYNAFYQVSDQTRLHDQIIGYVKKMLIFRYKRTIFRFFARNESELPTEIQLDKALSLLEYLHNSLLQRQFGIGLSYPQDANFYLMNLDIPANPTNLSLRDILMFWSFTDKSIVHPDITHSLVNLKTIEFNRSIKITLNPFWVEFAQAIDSSGTNITLTEVLFPSVRTAGILLAETRNNRFGIATECARLGMSYQEYKQASEITGQTPSGTVYLTAYTKGIYEMVQDIFR